MQNKFRAARAGLAPCDKGLGSEPVFSHYPSTKACEMKSPFLFLVTAVLLLTGCNQPAEADSVSGGGGTIEAINHTHWAINHFSVNGQSGIDIIGPWQGGGGAGYFGVPPKWEPGMTVKIDWETGEASTDDFPGFGDDKKVLEWEKK